MNDEPSIKICCEKCGTPIKMWLTDKRQKALDFVMNEVLDNCYCDSDELCDQCRYKQEIKEILA